MHLDSKKAAIVWLRKGGAVGRATRLLLALGSVWLGGCQGGLVLYDSAAARQREWEREHGPTMKAASDDSPGSAGRHYGAGGVVVDEAR